MFCVQTIIDRHKEEIMKKKSTIVPLTSPIIINPITDFMLALNPLGSSLGLLLLARDNDRAAVVVTFLVMLPVRAIAIKRTSSRSVQRSRANQKLAHQ
jgi:hypothetical protein